MRHKTGYQMAQVGDSIDLSYATVNSRRGRVGKEIAHTLTTGCQQGTVEVRPVKNPIKSDLARNTERTGKPGAPMHTLTTKDRHGVLYEGRIRRLTPRECLRLQGWADDRIDTALAIQSDNQAYKQAGNGVTVNVVEAIGRRIAKMDAELRGGGACPLHFRDQYFGCEIELTGINRATAAQTLADLFGTRAEHSGGGYDAYRVKDLDGKEWKIVRDSSIHPESRRRSVLIGETYKVELNSPKLEYGEMEKLQEVVRSLRRAGGIVNDSCGMHVHVDASKHTPQSLKNVLSIMYSKEDILFAALKVNPARIDSYCQAVDEPILEEIRKLPSGASMDQLKDRWYRGRDGSDYHYHQSRYHALNLHSVFYHGTVEWRLFNSTLHAGEVKANIILAMAISAQGINQKYTQFRKTPIGDNPAFTFRTFLLRLGLIGPEYKNVRMHLLKNLPGDKAWRHDKSLYPSNQPRLHTDEVR